MKSSESALAQPGLRIGSVLEGRYRIVGELGAGGVGTVFRAEHLKLGHHVAVKVLQPHLVTDVQFRPRFEREARALATLAHPHVVAWTDYSFADGCPYLVMELLDGRSLRVDIARGPLAAERVERILRQALATLVHAHGLGFVHRDLKPDNIFLLDFPSEPDFVKLLDFGFVKLVRSDAADPERSQLTASGMGMGTPTYMSPEQAWGDKTGPASDLYSLGIIAYEMLTGRRPFTGDVAVIVRQHMTEPLPALDVDGLVATPELRAFLDRATEKRSTDRFESAQAMLDALDALPTPWLVPRRRFGRAATKPTPPTPVRAWPRAARAVVALAGAAALVGAGLHFARGRTPAPSASRVHDRPATHAGVPAESLATSVTSPEPVAPPATVPADVPAPSTTTDGAFGPSPFDTRARLPLLWNAHRQLSSGRGLARSTESAILRWSRGQPRDPRPSLLLAADAAFSHADGRAVSLYVAANRIAADARNDPRMVRNLVRIVAENRQARAASDALESIFGALALDAVDEELLRIDLSPAGRTRLTRLRARLERAGSRAASPAR